MNQTDYREATARTWNTNTPEQYQPANAALGVVGEVREFIDDPTVDEAGDVLYYLTTLRRLVGLPVLEKYRLNGENLPIEIPPTAFRLAEYVKKHVFHGDDHARSINAATQALFGQLTAAMQGFAGMDAVRAANIAKLTDRHPDGFERADE
jgi:hypothetical protein